MQNSALLTTLLSSGVITAAIVGFFGYRQASRTKSLDKDVEVIKVKADANTSLIDDLNDDRKQLRAEQLEDRKQISELRQQLDGCLIDKTHESIAFEKRIATLESEIKKR